jgi:DNA primase large subunit
MSAKEENSQGNSIKSDIPPTFYNKVGQDFIIDISKLTTLVIERYKILRRIEKFYRKKKKIKQYVKENLPEEIRWGIDDDNYIKNDISSHFMLELIMCRNESDKRWFITQETKLYNARINILRRYSMYKILLKLGLALKELKEEDDSSIDINKIRFRLIKNPRKKENEKIYFCKFEDALNLVMTHEYYIYMGNIYIPESDLPSLFKLVFIQNMENTISKIRANLERGCFVLTSIAVTPSSLNLHGVYIME